MYSDVVEALICRLILSYPEGCPGGIFSSEEDSALLLASTDPAELELPSVEKYNVSILKTADNTSRHVWRR
jgi:hypothetical protein